MMPFTPTHRVPAGGMDSWPRPDAQAPRGPRIDEGLLVDTTDRIGDWAKVVFDNGWSAWVDGRLLTPMQPTGRATDGPGGAKSFDLAALFSDRTKATGIVGALLVALASVLPWLRGGGQTVNGFDVRAKFLIDHQTTATSGLTVGVLLLVLAAIDTVAIARASSAQVTRTLGGLTIAVPALYLVQLQRTVSDVAGASITDFVGIGTIAALVGAALVMFAPQLGKRPA